MLPAVGSRNGLGYTAAFAKTAYDTADIAGIQAEFLAKQVGGWIG
jgi:hypothetical protein